MTIDIDALRRDANNITVYYAGDQDAARQRHIVVESSQRLASAVPELLDEITTLRARLAECESENKHIALELSVCAEMLKTRDLEYIELSRQHADDAKRIAELTEALERVKYIYDVDGDCMRCGDVQAVRDALATERHSDSISG